jgi:lactate 2-monooxygenase
MWAEGESVTSSTLAARRSTPSRTIITRFVADPGLGGSWGSYYDEWPFALVPDEDPLYAVVPALASAAGHVVTAPTFGKWNADLRAIIGEQPRIALAGVSTDCCVIATALPAADAGAQVRVAAAGCAGSSEENHRRALDAMALFGPQITLRAPLLLAPVGAGCLVAADSDVQIARGAATAGVPYVFTNQGCKPPGRNGGRHGRRAVVVPTVLVDRRGARGLAHRSGRGCGSCGAGHHARHHDVGVATTGPEPGLAAVCSRAGHCAIHVGPRFRELVASRVAAAAAKVKVKEKVRPTVGAVRSLIEMSRSHPGDFRANLTSPEPRAAVETFLEIYSNPALSWAHLETLRERTRLPVVLKGILHPDDARRAFELGVDAIVVSNHGGRQVDRAIASLDALVSIREAIGRQPVVLFDSGLRTGADLFVALALGADACLLGRPHIYGLALDGADGVASVVENVMAELDLTMGLTGVGSIPDLVPGLLTRT